VLLPESPRTDRPLPDEGRVPYVLVWPYIAITFVGFTAYTMIMPIISLRLMDQGSLDAKSALGQAGIVLTIASLALFLSQSVVAAREGWDARLLLRAGSLGALAGLGALASATSLTMTVAAMLVVGAALGFVGPANLGAISLATGSQAQGKVAGINAAARGLGIALGPITGTLLYRADHIAPFLGALLLVGLIVILSWLPMPSSRKSYVS